MPLKVSEMLKLIEADTVAGKPSKELPPGTERSPKTIIRRPQ